VTRQGGQLPERRVLDGSRLRRPTGRPQGVHRLTLLLDNHAFRWICQDDPLLSTGSPRASSASSCSVPIQIRMSMIGPSSPMGISRRGMRSGHYVGEIDHRLGVDDLPDQEWDDAEPTVTFPQRGGAIRKGAQNVSAFDEDEFAGLLAQ